MTTTASTSDDTLFDMNKKKKSKKLLKVSQQVETTITTDSTDDAIQEETVTEINFSYDYLLNRAFDIIRQKYPERFNQGKVVVALPPLQVARVGTRRTAFLNFGSICTILKRQEKQLYDFFLVELGTTANIDSKHALIIRGRFQPKQLEHVLRSFISEYVFCKTCRSPNTLLRRSDGLTMINCNDCNSQYSVSTIRTKAAVNTNRH
ncbi:unnamed protein product [Rotaria magnacalcarata]|uniref:Eukaryotic translation initiation factor 2 subunit 2 n=1 Tax=Rotaria magnacalcarata TaxID=392030 RepID=A0A814TNC8_9BILA|nr:unnamed protein product [Rotaria magnacalcarata]CAF1530302.1 unnamed protein product [Rotaria magnacalcarata]CAF2131475.1 unnamed protein product [Rotaria magnacalcarata]CAF3897922.1 unnamed protein product [Rotaria magnacalcarata]CAF3951783.1 unnamed protein product [Rotaria magnacalcarata]